MEVSEEKKLEVLLSQLHERYEAIHKMRDRSMQFVLWILGFGLGMAWLLINGAALTCSQQYAITVLLILLSVATLLFVRAIERGFKTNRQIVIKLETALKLYEQNFYNIPDPILPPHFTRTKTKWTDHFKTLYGLIIIVFLALVILICTVTSEPRSYGASAPFDPNQIQIQTINE